MRLLFSLGLTLGLAGVGPADDKKADALMEILSEAMVSGHRTLVFSQFVEMLTLIRRALEKEGVRYEYLVTACDLATRTGDTAAIAAVVRELEAQFVVNGPEVLLAAALAAVGRRVGPIPCCFQLAQ